MQSLSACLVVAALLVAAPVNAQFQINTPASVTQCVPTEFTWTGGQEPYFLVISPLARILELLSRYTLTSPALPSSGAPTSPRELPLVSSSLIPTARSPKVLPSPSSLVPATAA
ncbi:hypothetical protein LXA43DRAFT_374720 [Ganoderma leucocontextum]|nr:hypothetical protein LXA43DRAFT_374720 [Ganoderma leucocontextum]